jgi:ABC-type uncharacterized transport system substrate-binding protein
MNFRKAIVAFIFIFLVPLQLLAAEKGKKITIIHSSAKSLWDHGINHSSKKTIEKLGTKVRIKSINFPVDRIRRNAPHDIEKEKLKIIELTKQYKPDVILLCDDEATEILMPAFMELGLTTFVTGINDLEMTWKRDSWKNLQAGVIEKYPICEMVNFLKKVRPNCKRISILSSRSTTSIIVANNIKRLFETGEIERKSGISLQDIHLLEKYSAWEKCVPNLGLDNDALFVLVPYEVIDENGCDVPPEQIGSLLKSHLKIPMIGIISIHARIGLFASISVDGAGLGRQSAEQIHRYFNGEAMQDLGFEDIRYHNFEINANEADRLNISIPADFYGLTHFF